ncbi:hypothetical protein [Sphingobacterium sp. FBM7-1]|uniref:hypothetical protein n=1 Tax=Sphingobacterium sp. FBM7-1 TaxID=2886688 RepID=UPI001D0F4B25|nr:hypothetical protein [Sphingobacterium sp. FBM7-1]MCC2600498.1 hypothetical protein [Sphingobacterium sp. FBM7-1]
MKNILYLFIFFSTTCTYAQSVSVSKLMKILKTQNLTDISSELKELGFIYRGKRQQDGFSIMPYTKKNTIETTEELVVSVNDELFSLLYKVNPNFFNAYKSKLLTDDFSYSYEANGNRYYENNNMRIGFNEKSYIISLFTKLN